MVRPLIAIVQGIGLGRSIEAGCGARWPTGLDPVPGMVVP